jgi:predicted lipoprotein with Yx(FWY)xxD motif
MRRHLITGLVALAAVAAGCGEDDTGETAAAVGGGGAATVAVEEVADVGRVLVDSGGAALYTAEQEDDGTIRCVDECLAFWEPLTVPDGEEPAAGDDVPGALAAVERPDGSRQVTYDGVPVYRFSEDPAGEVTGNGLEDSFGGTTFSWKVVSIGASTEGGGGGRGGVYGY